MLLMCEVPAERAERICMKTIGLKSDRLKLGKDFIWNFTRNIQVNEANVLVTASSTGSPVEGLVSKVRAGFCLHLSGPNMDLDPTDDGDGFIILCHGKDAVDALKEAVSHLYQVIVKEKIDIREVEAIEELRGQNT